MQVEINCKDWRMLKFRQTEAWKFAASALVENKIFPFSALVFTVQLCRQIPFYLYFDAFVVVLVVVVQREIKMRLEHSA